MRRKLLNWNQESNCLWQIKGLIETRRYFSYAGLFVLLLASGLVGYGPFPRSFESGTVANWNQESNCLWQVKTLSVFVPLSNTREIDGLSSAAQAVLASRSATLVRTGGAA
jgi:hypothetical protein